LVAIDTSACRFFICDTRGIRSRYKKGSPPPDIIGWTSTSQFVHQAKVYIQGDSLLELVTGTVKVIARVAPLGTHLATKIAEVGDLDIHLTKISTNPRAPAVLSLGGDPPGEFATSDLPEHVRRFQQQL
jgi:hypothetical protein